MPMLPGFTWVKKKRQWLGWLWSPVAMPAAWPRQSVPSHLHMNSWIKLFSDLYGPATVATKPAAAKCQQTLDKATLLIIGSVKYRVKYFIAQPN